MSSIYGAIKAMTDLSDKLFYLTAKSSGKMSAIRAVDLLISKGLKIKALELSSKQKMCNKGSKFVIQMSANLPNIFLTIC